MVILAVNLFEHPNDLEGPTYFGLYRLIRRLNLCFTGGLSGKN